MVCVLIILEDVVTIEEADHGDAFARALELIRHRDLLDQFKVVFVLAFRSLETFLNGSRPVTFKDLSHLALADQEDGALVILTQHVDDLLRDDLATLLSIQGEDVGLGRLELAADRNLPVGEVDRLNVLVRVENDLLLFGVFARLLVQDLNRCALEEFFVILTGTKDLEVDIYSAFEARVDVLPLYSVL